MFVFIFGLIAIVMIMKDSGCYAANDCIGRMLIYPTMQEYAEANHISQAGQQRLFFFDMDNTLYSKSTGVSRWVGDRIRAFLTDIIKLPPEESLSLAAKFRTEYGLAIKGCLQHFDIDPAEYDAFVDGGVPLEDILKAFDLKERKAIEGADARRWIFTNAGILHTERVLRILGIRDLFEGIVHCVYTEPQFPAKPGRSAYARAVEYATKSFEPVDEIYFVDDAEKNIQTALELGWKAVLVDEDNDIELPREGNLTRIQSLRELSTVFPMLYNK